MSTVAEVVERFESFVAALAACGADAALVLGELEDRTACSDRLDELVGQAQLAMTQSAMIGQAMRDAIVAVFGPLSTKHVDALAAGVDRALLVDRLSVVCETMGVDL